MTRRLITILVGALCAGQASAAVLNFDDLPFIGPEPPFVPADLPGDYAGFQWANWCYADLGVWCGEWENTSDLPSNFKFVGNSEWVDPVTLSASTPFDFVGAYVATNAQDDAFASFSSRRLRVQGFRNGSLVGEAGIDLSCKEFSWFAADLKGVDTLVFDNGGTASGGQMWVLDNFTYEKAASVPGPAAAIAFAVGLLRRRKRR